MDTMGFPLLYDGGPGPWPPAIHGLRLKRKELAPHARNEREGTRSHAKAAAVTLNFKDV